MKTCITAPEPIEATHRFAATGHIVAAEFIAKRVEPLLFIFTCENATICAPSVDLIDPSPALLAFIQRAENELLPKKKRTMAEVTKADLYSLLRVGNQQITSAQEIRDLYAWASERNIQLPEGE